MGEIRHNTNKSARRLQSRRATPREFVVEDELDDAGNRAERRLAAKLRRQPRRGDPLNLFQPHRKA